MKIDKLTIEYSSDLKIYGHTEDGDEFVGEVFYIYATNEYGSRWRFHYHFDGVRKVGSTFIDAREEARGRCECLISLIEQKGEINLKYWDPDRPVYGSKAYSEYGQLEDCIREHNEG